MIPETTDAITASWLTDAISRAEPGLVIDSAVPIDVIHGASSKLRISLRTNRNDFPATVIVKGGFENHSGEMTKMHLNEMHAYRDLIPTLQVDAPHCFYADGDAAGNTLVILEDLNLRGAHFLSLLKPIGFDLAAAFIEKLAAIHARWWDTPELQAGGRFEWVPDTSEEQFDFYFYILTDSSRFESYITAPRGAAMPVMFHDADRIRRAHAAMRASHAGQPMVINHGDMHLGNLYTNADGTPGFLDWQPRKAPWSLDVTYFLIAGLDLVDRRRWQAALIQHYLTCLTAYGVVPPSFDAAWLAYRRDVIWGFLIWLLNGSHFQTESNNTAAATRFAMAMLDLDCFGALGV